MLSKNLQRAFGLSVIGEETIPIFFKQNFRVVKYFSMYTVNSLL